MTRVIGVRFRPAGKIYYFAPGKFHIRQGGKVIVETARGIEFGTVVAGPKEVKDEEVMQPLKSVIRIATEEDKRAEEKNREKEKEAFEICLEKIRKHNLDMKLINAEYTFDNNKVLFYFTADGRIDFRELVKDLAAVFRTRIELRQIGVRDETKIRGRHTTTRRQMFFLPGGAALIDTPGMRELGLWDSESGLETAFADIEALARQCRFQDCRHEKEPGCAVRAALASGELSEERFRSWQRLSAENRYADDRAAHMSAKEKKFRMIAQFNKSNSKR